MLQRIPIVQTRDDVCCTAPWKPEFLRGFFCALSVSLDQSYSHTWTMELPDWYFTLTGAVTKNAWGASAARKTLKCPKFISSPGNRCLYRSVTIDSKRGISALHYWWQLSPPLMDISQSVGGYFSPQPKQHWSFEASTDINISWSQKKRKKKPQQCSDCSGKRNNVKATLTATREPV